MFLPLWVPLSALGAVSETPRRDGWFSRDKAAHYGVSVALAGGGYAAGALLFAAPEARWLTGAGVGLGAGVAKELLDAARGSFFSWKDLTWDGLGTASGLALSWAVDRLVFSRAEPVREPAVQMRFSLALGPGVSGHPQAGSSNGRTVPVVLFLTGGW